MDDFLVLKKFFEWVGVFFILMGGGGVGVHIGGFAKIGGGVNFKN